MPKLDLHLHIDGALRTRTILELAREQNHSLPADNVEDLNRFVRVSPDCRSLTEFLATFEVFYDLLRQPAALERVTRELCQDLKQQGVIYAELRFAPVLNVRDLGHSRAEMREIISAVLAAVTGEETEDFQAQLILCCYRGFDTVHAQETVELAHEFRQAAGSANRIAAVDLAGDESRYPAAAFRAPFDLAQRLGIPVTVHAAEAAGPESAADALDLLHARRIGHGIRIREDAALLERVRKERIPLEVCLTSNLQTQTVKSLDEHPFLAYLDGGLCVTLNTDDPSISGITLSGEWELAAKKYRLTNQQLRLLALNSVEAAFCSSEKRAELTKRVETFFAAAK